MWGKKFMKAAHSVYHYLFSPANHDRPRDTSLSHISLATMSEQASTSTSTAPSKSATPAAEDVDIEKLLSREATAFQREIEVERILKAFKLKYVPSHVPLIIHAKPQKARMSSST